VAEGTDPRGAAPPGAPGEVEAGTPADHALTGRATLQTRRRWPQSLRALDHRNFRLFFAGQLISMIGTWMQSVAQAWLVYRLTGSAALLGAVGFASQIPVFMFAPLGGAMADRYGRHRIIVTTQVLAMVLASILTAVTFAGIVEVWQIFVLASLLGVVNAFDLPARQSFVIEMVGRRDLVNAIALNSSIVNGARMVGPAVAGVIVAAFGEAWCFLANSALRCACRAERPFTTRGPPSAISRPDSPTWAARHRFWRSFCSWAW
jgi:MFS family permease